MAIEQYNKRTPLYDIDTISPELKESEAALKQLGQLKDADACQQIFKWQQRIEAVTGINCVHIRDVCKNDFTIDALENAQEKDRIYFKGLAIDILKLC